MATSTNASPNVLIVAAEASSSLYAQRLLEHWQQQDQSIHAFGVGSRSMERLGFEVLGRSEELAVVGLQEVISHYGQIRAVFYNLIAEAKRRRPKVALLLDYPDFNLRLAKELKKIGIPVVYYISPQVWAWRQSRVHKIKKLVDKMLVLFPFEVDFYQKHSVPVEFVGHPLLDELDDKYFSEEYLNERRSRYGITKNDVMLALMPGSRRSEMKHHLKTQLDVAERLHSRHRGLKIAMFVAPTFTKEEIQAMLPPLDFPLMLIQDEPFDMIHVADVILCASGTATLMVGLMEKPLIIMYKMNGLTAFLAKRFVKSTKYFGMINLVLDKEVGPEYFQEQASVEQLSQALEPLITDGNKRKNVADELRVAKTRLGEKGATVRVAEALEEFISD